MPRGLKDAGVPRLSLTGPSNLPLPYLSFPTDKLMPATLRERRKNCSPRPLDGWRVEQPRTSSSPLWEFRNFWYCSPSPPSVVQRSGEVATELKFSAALGNASISYYVSHSWSKQYNSTDEYLCNLNSVCLSNTYGTLTLCSQR